eukprot:6547898-Alexandrium_andersonii.AAC.1
MPFQGADRATPPRAQALLSSALENNNELQPPKRILHCETTSNCRARATRSGAAPPQRLSL